MISLFKTLVTALTIAASPALAGVSFIVPAANSVCQGSQSCMITWEEDYNSPSLAEIESANVGLYVNTITQPTLLQPILPGPANIAMNSGISFVVDPSIGPNGNYYFIRFTSTTWANSNGHYIADSPKFRLEHMTGTFSPTVRDHITALPDSGTSFPDSETSITGTRTLSSPATAATASTGAALKNDGAGSFVACVAVIAGVVTLF